MKKYNGNNLCEKSFQSFEIELVDADFILSCKEYGAIKNVLQHS